MANVPFFFDGERKVFVSSAANRTTALAVENPGAHYHEIGGNLYESDGLVWNQISIGGAALVTETPTGITLIDDTGTYTYIGKAPSGSATSSAVWTIRRITNATGSTYPVSGNALAAWDNRASETYA